MPPLFWLFQKSIASGHRRPTCWNGSSMLEQLIQEIRRREKVIRIFPNKASAWRLVGALLAEKHEEWSTGRRYWTMDEFYEWRDRQRDSDAEDLQPESSNRTLQPA